MKIRINQDVTFNWKLTVEGESVDLSKLELSVEITTPSNKKTEITPTIKFDTLEFNYRPKQIGEYILSAYLNRFKDGETALDIKAFEGVKYTWNQDFSTDDNLAANYVELAGDLNYGYKLDINKVTYTDLVNLKNNAQLTSGRLYRITDYITTTTQEGTKSAGHPFDVIVLALSESELSERAWAIQHEGDEYFANSDLNAWQIWYCLDNDINRFSWADETNGKGVIYRMIDEWNNDVPYDFKNIQFYRKWDSNKSLWSIISSNNTGVPCYTFSSKGSSSTTSFTDMSLDASNEVYSNVIKEYANDGKQTLNNICFFGYKCYSNSFCNSCYNNTLGSSCYYNTLGSKCHSNYLSDRCYGNLFGENCFDNTFRKDCQYNSFGNNFYLNSFGESCYENTFGNYCQFNLLGSNCHANTFGSRCVLIRFISNSSLPNIYHYYQYNHFGDGCEYINFSGAETASSESQVQNYNFAQGLQGTSDNYLIVEGKRNRAYETKVAKNSNGELKIYCEADSIQ